MDPHPTASNLSSIAEVVDEKRTKDKIRASFLAEASDHTSKRHSELLPFAQQCRQLLARTEQIVVAASSSSASGSPTIATSGGALGTSHNSPSPSKRRGGSKSPRAGAIIDMSSAVDTHQSARMTERLNTLRKEVQQRRIACKQKDLLIAEFNKKLDDQGRRKFLASKTQSDLDDLNRMVINCTNTAKNRIQSLEQRLSLDSLDRKRGEGDVRTLQARLQQLEEEADDLRQRKNRVQDELDLLRRSNAELGGGSPSGKNRGGGRRGSIVVQDVPTIELSSEDSSDMDEIDDEEFERLKVRKAELLKRIMVARNKQQFMQQQQQVSLPDEQDDVDLMSETMSLMESTAIWFRSDLKRMRLIQGLSHGDKEAKFKAAHNEVKVALGFLLSGEEAKRFNNGLIDVWPVTAAMIEESFHEHKLTTTLNSLKDMVITWDGLPIANKRRLSTARNVISNAPLLFFLTRYVVREHGRKMKKRMFLANVAPTEVNHVLTEKTQSSARMSSPQRTTSMSPRNSTVAGGGRSFRRESSVGTGDGSPRGFDGGAARSESPSSFRRRQSSGYGMNNNYGGASSQPGSPFY